MRIIFHTLALILFVAACKTDKKANIALDPIVSKAKETSLYTANVDWPQVNTKFIELTKNKKTVEEIKEGLQYLINSLGDKHGVFRSTTDYSIVVSYQGENQKKDNRDSKFVGSVINDIEAKFSYQLIENNIGYLRVVGIGPGDVKEQADFIRQGLLDLKENGVNQWILDLRYNGGGNVEPMIAGLAPLIGEGFIGGAINRNNEIRDYKIENSQFTNFGRLSCEMVDLPKITKDEKVAVLLSRYTASSGESLAITFKGRDNTIFIGEETAGYTTGNGYDVIRDDLALVISQDVFIDRNKKRYDNKLGVDVEIEFQHNDDLEGDNQVSHAIAWLRE